MTPNNALRDWWKTRVIPASRKNLSETLSYLNVKNSKILMLKHYGLNLSDHYWVVPEDLLEKGTKWEDVNFLQNDFDWENSECKFDLTQGRIFYFYHDCKRFWKYVRPVCKSR